MTDFTGADALMLLGAVPVASVCVNAGGIIVFANEAAGAMSGPGSALVRTPVSRLLPEWHSVSSASAKSFRRETLLLRGDGSVIPVELLGRAVR